jgi:hypothetical protein
MRSLNLLQFIALPVSNQQRYIAKNCTYLSYRNESETVLVYLYCGGKFFIEVWYDEEQIDIVRLRPFTSLKLLEPYLHRIDICSDLPK